MWCWHVDQSRWRPVKFFRIFPRSVLVPQICSGIWSDVHAYKQGRQRGVDGHRVNETSEPPSNLYILIYIYYYYHYYDYDYYISFCHLSTKHSMLSCGPQLKFNRFVKRESMKATHQSRCKMPLALGSTLPGCPKPTAATCATQRRLQDCLIGFWGNFDSFQAIFGFISQVILSLTFFGSGGHSVFQISVPSEHVGISFCQSAGGPSRCKMLICRGKVNKSQIASNSV